MRTSGGLKRYLDESGSSSFCLVNRVLSVDDVKLLVEQGLPQKKIAITLHNNRLGDEGAVLLAHAIRKTTSSLRSLTIANNWVGDVGAVALVEVAGSAQLRHLDLRNNRITDAGISLIQKALEQNYSLETLNLRGNNGLLLVCPRDNGSLVRLFDQDPHCERNAIMHERARDTTVALIALRTTRRCLYFPRELIAMIARSLWNTRADIDAWNSTAKRRKI